MRLTPRHGAQHMMTSTIDHMRYLNDRPYRREVHALYRRIANRSGLWHLTVVHEIDGSCCDKEPWRVTSIRIMQALNDDGVRAALVVV